jgi:hypothetical protein
MREEEDGWMPGGLNLMRKKRRRSTKKHMMERGLLPVCSAYI